MSYSINFNRLPVRLATLTLETFDANLFLRSVSERRPGAETVGDRLDDPATLFLPFEIDEGTELFRVSGIAYVEYAGPLPEVEAEGAMGAKRPWVELVLTTGETLAGELLYILPPGRHRVLDHLNDPEVSFLRMRRPPEATLYVNKAAVLRVRT